MENEDEDIKGQIKMKFDNQNNLTGFRQKGQNESTLLI